MFEQATKPVIFLAFANVASNPLPSLAQECRQLTELIKSAEEQGLCTLEVAPNAIIKDIFNIFDKAAYRGRIAVFHFAGHADHAALIFEGSDGAPAIANAGGLAAYLGQQKGLRLIFLNGCSTQPQVQALLEAGVDAVIATSQRVTDRLAAEFAGYFYQSLVGDCTIQEAFDQAFNKLSITAKDPVREWHVVGAQQPAPAEPGVTNAASWTLHERPGADHPAQWKLSTGRDEDVDVAVLQELLNTFFRNGVKLDSFCMIHYPEIYEQFDAGMQRDQKINLLLSDSAALASRRKALMAHIRHQWGQEVEEVLQRIYTQS